MGKIKRWLLDKQQVIWSEPALPKYVKINPLSPPGAAEGVQPGDFSMLKITEEFLAEAEEFREAPEEGPALSSRRAADQHALDLAGALEYREDPGGTGSFRTQVSGLRDPWYQHGFSTPCPR